MVRGLLLVGLILLLNDVVSPAAEQAAEPSAELRAFALQLVKIVESQDRKAFAELIDWEQILANSVWSKFEFVSLTDRKEFEASFLQASRDIEKPFYKKYLPDNELVTLVHIKPNNDQSFQVFLRCFTDGRTQILDYRIKHKANQSLKIIDLGLGGPACSISAAFEYSSLIAHRMEYVKSLGPLEYLRGWLTRNNDLFADFGLAASTDDYSAVIKLYSQLSKEIQQMQAVEFLYYRANALAEKPVVTMAELRAYYDKAPDTAKLDLIRCYAITKGDLKSALNTLDESDKLLAVDSLNNLQRAEFLTELKQFKQAYDCVNKLVRDYPDWQRSHIMLMVVSLYDKNYRTTLKQLQLLRDKFQLDLVELVDTDDDYKEFRKSPEYGVWKKENDAAASPNKK